MKKLWILSLVLVLVIGGAYVVRNERIQNPPTAGGDQNAYITLQAEEVVLRARVADTNDTRRQGLSGRPGLAEDEVLLFVFDAPGRHGIWMKDMLFSIDILWLDQNGSILHLEKDVSPDTFPTTFSPSSEAWYVVEAAAGFADKNNLSEGKSFMIPQEYSRP